MNAEIKLITESFTHPSRQCVIGNIAVVRGAMEAGIRGVFSYPGTPSTEISNTFSALSVRNKDGKDAAIPYFEFSINEKIALEKAIAFSIGNKRAICVMKNVGLNVASDALMSITYQCIGAGLVIVTCDDPGCHSSSNEQDSRYWGMMAGVPVLAPATPEEALRACRSAFDISESLKLPVILRMTTRVSHTRGTVHYGTLPESHPEARFERLPEHINIPARTAAAHARLIDKLNSDLMHQWQTRLTISDKGTGKKAIIASGVAAAIAKSYLPEHDAYPGFMALMLVHPFPEAPVLSFLSHYDEVLVLEELEPLVENNIRLVSEKNGLQCRIYGKSFSFLSPTGEYTPDIVHGALRDFLAIEAEELPSLPGAGQWAEALAPRPPALCAGCPHRATFYALKMAVPHDHDSDTVLCGDIGCFGLGALPPLKMIDTINHMGMSISMAQGLSSAAANNGNKVIAMLGDGTFFHSGIPSLLNAVYTKANILVIIFDNRTIGMTGHQEHPGAASSDHEEIALEPLIRGMGVKDVRITTPFNLPDTYQAINSAMAKTGVSVIISKSPCVFVDGYSDEHQTAHDRRIAVDPLRCNTCHNHRDMAISCSRNGSPESNLSRARARLEADINIDALQQQCPANICNHGFLNAIREGDEATALKMVRDKMLFARSCGDICHRPCELFAGKDAAPIKALKKYVSAIDSNFRDFSPAVEQIEIHKRQQAPKVAIVGCGPAGLSAAYDLVRRGYHVVMYDRAPEPGGLVKYAIPKFRMDKNGYDFEANALRYLGVEMMMNTELGKDIHLEELRTQYDAVLLATGLRRSKTLPVIKEHLSDKLWIDALSFLESYNIEDVRDLPGRMAVIGGGNSAIDAARSAKRCRPQAELHIICIEWYDEMPAFREEVKKAEEEGIRLHCGMKLAEARESSHQARLVLHSLEGKSADEELVVDLVIVAIGQEAETICAEYQDNDQGRMSNEEKSSRIHGNLFVAGDLCSGNHQSVIGAIASGKKAAVGIMQHLDDYGFDYEGIESLKRLNTSTPSGVETKGSQDGIAKAALKWNLFQSCAKCNHCIDNFGCPALVREDGKVHIVDNLCTQCGLCIDVCPNGAIGWVTKETEYAVS